MVQHFGENYHFHSVNFGPDEIKYKTEKSGYM